MRHGRTRYFILTRVDPNPKDIETFVNSCKTIMASHYGYCVKQVKKDKRLLRGFFVLSGNTAWVSQLESMFPNFLLTKMPSDMDTTTLEELEHKDHLGLVVVGKHPYVDCKINLFKEEFKRMRI